MAASVAHIARSGPLLTGLIFTLLLTACGGGGSTAGGGTSQTLTLNGTVSMGDRVRSSAVYARAINADGTDGDSLGSVLTDVDGKFQLTVTTPSGTAVRLSAEGGTADDVPTGQTITVSSGALILDLPPSTGTLTSLQITPITTFAHKIGKKKIADGQAIATAIRAAHQEVGVQFGITTLDAAGNIVNGDITTTLPRISGTATAAEQRYELGLLGLAQQAKDLGVNPTLLVNSMARDAEDGKFDGKAGSVTVQITITITLPSDAAAARYISALASFLSSGQNTTSLTTTSSSVTQVTNTTLSSVQVYPSLVSLSVGQTQDFYPSAYNTTGSSVPISTVAWASSNSAIVSVSASGTSGSIGRATGVGTGTATITATVGGITGTATVTVVSTLATISSAPIGVAATPGNAQVIISWNPVAGATSYTLYMASQSGVTKTNYASLTNGMKHAGVTSPYTHTGLTNGTTYYFIVTAVNTNGESVESTQVSATPSAVSPTATALAAGSNHTCVLLSGGAVKCGGHNLFGQLGAGTTTPSSIPVSVSGITTATQVVAGFDHTCVLLSGGAVKCWGRNDVGELANGTKTGPETCNAFFRCSTTPVTVSGITTATQVAVGGGHTCVLLSGGAVKCGGNNFYGQLGDGTTTERLTPVLVSGITTATQVAVGGNHTCALLSGGAVKCWGVNGSGQLGDGTTTSSTTPVTVSGITTATQVVAGVDYTCVRLLDSTVQCWGWNGFGQLGAGTTTPSSIPVSVSGITTATQVAAGGFHACVLLSGGAVKCWGYNFSGELGNGTDTGSKTCGTSPCSTTPVTVSGITTATQVAVGGGHTCVLLSGGAVKCWGNNFKGQLGDGTTTNSPTPVPVSGIP